MTVTCWVLVQTEVGKARAVADAMRDMTRGGVTVLSSDTVTGPHDVIVRLQGPDLDTLNEAVEQTLEAVPGVEHTLTCLTIG